MSGMIVGFGVGIPFPQSFGASVAPPPGNHILTEAGNILTTEGGDELITET